MDTLDIILNIGAWLIAGLTGIVATLLHGRLSRLEEMIEKLWSRFHETDVRWHEEIAYIRDELSKRPDWRDMRWLITGKKTDTQDD